MDGLNFTAPAVIPAFVEQKISVDIRDMKYALKGETSRWMIANRVINAVFEGDPRADEFAAAAVEAVESFCFLPAGRVLAGAGAVRRVTWVNCFVNEEVEDSLRGIHRAEGRMAETLQKGGGMGTDFSPIRPKGAHVAGTDTPSSGVISFAHCYDSKGQTVESAGSRRGAQMGTLRIDHPDIWEFITAKGDGKSLKGLNLSVLVTDQFMAALKADGLFDLGHFVRPHDLSQCVEVSERLGKPWYVYQRVRATELWDAIMRATYGYAEPGVIFIDRVNDLNNLAYCEYIAASNPCGEQMLPPNGACVLGQNWLPMFVRNAFTAQAYFDFGEFEKAAALAVRVMDNVIDRSPFPFEEQKAEAQAKRRIGIGTPGLGDALCMLGLRYGSRAALKMVARIKRFHRDACYRASVELAKERGAFPLFSKDEYMARPFIKRLPADIREGIDLYGIRNALLLSDAPAGTTGLFAFNMSAGIEPVFSLKYDRVVTLADGSQVKETVYDAAYLLFCKLNGLDPDSEETIKGLPPCFVTTNDLDVKAHIYTQAMCQRYVDSSISKTVNVPEDIEFDAFKDVYRLAYDMGCKGTTTFRPNNVTGAVMSVEKKEEGVSAEALAAKTEAVLKSLKVSLPDILDSKRYKAKWAGTDENYFFTVSYITLPDGSNHVVELFINSNRNDPNSTAIGKLMSHILRHGCDPKDAVQMLISILDAEGGFCKVPGLEHPKYVPSLPSLIGEVLNFAITDIEAGKGHRDCGCKGGCDHKHEAAPAAEVQVVVEKTVPGAGKCPKCGQKTYVVQSGCGTCYNGDCNYSRC